MSRRVRVLKSNPRAVAARSFAKRFVEIHNAAADRYKEAFKAVGARMWHDDDAHKLGPKNEQFIAEQIASARGDEWQRQYQIARPLTVLDAYPDVTPRQRAALKTKVDQIHAEATREWDDAREGTWVTLNGAHVLIAKEGV